MTTQKEIRNLLNRKAPSIVDERIIPEIHDLLAKWGIKLFKTLETVDAKNRKVHSDAFNQLYYGLKAETVNQLINLKYAQTN